MTAADRTSISGGTTSTSAGRSASTPTTTACWMSGKLSGVDTDNDGVIDINLPALGANPFRKDVFVQAGFLQAATHTHSPAADFDQPDRHVLCQCAGRNPDGTTGIQLHVDVGPLYGANSIFSVTGAGRRHRHLWRPRRRSGTAIPEAGNEIIEAFDDALGSATKFDDLKAANFAPVRGADLPLHHLRPPDERS